MAQHIASGTDQGTSTAQTQAQAHLQSQLETSKLFLCEPCAPEASSHLQMPLSTIKPLKAKVSIPKPRVQNSIPQNHVRCCFELSHVLLHADSDCVVGSSQVIPRECLYHLQLKQTVILDLFVLNTLAVIGFLHRRCGLHRLLLLSKLLLLANSLLGVASHWIPLGLVSLVDVEAATGFRVVLLLGSSTVALIEQEVALVTEVPNSHDCLNGGVRGIVLRVDEGTDEAQGQTVVDTDEFVHTVLVGILLLLSMVGLIRFLSKERHHVITVLRSSSLGNFGIVLLDLLLRRRSSQVNGVRGSLGLDIGDILGRGRCGSILKSDLRQSGSGSRLTNNWLGHGDGLVQVELGDWESQAIVGIEDVSSVGRHGSLMVHVGNLGLLDEARLWGSQHLAHAIVSLCGRLRKSGSLGRMSVSLVGDGLALGRIRRRVLGHVVDVTKRVGGRVDMSSRSLGLGLGVLLGDLGGILRGGGSCGHLAVTNRRLGLSGLLSSRRWCRLITVSSTLTLGKSAFIRSVLLVGFSSLEQGGLLLGQRGDDGARDGRGLPLGIKVSVKLKSGANL
ncbi:hypothetical protein BGZ61DRAFT_138187 [Ilyonectria robusta]|uniref:uncharacterized protein n=1 Tax=Ilyonectria robusta TaxID=1079257 RepID=UPI001E8E710A|nr:uncharacterized protein BGZ61DRAFT_138187 [Ilyonectria robusta]KAH8735302.1 hypothetical protein BGZ61DRAFT_138187 [Ilyonectria robusta]